jgi:hypothetical protein
MNNFEKQKQRILDGGFKYVSLYQGSKQKAARNNLGKLNEKLEEIENILKNDFPGSYQIHALSSTGKNITPVIFEVNTDSMSENKSTVIYKEPQNDKLLENQRILDLTVKVKELEMQNDYLRGQIDDLENEIAELEAKAAEAPELGEQTPVPGLLESAKDFLGSLMEFGAPLLDQHFALKQQQLEIERMKLNNRRPAQTPAQVQKSETVQIRKLGELVEMYNDQPEIYEALHEISAKSQSVSEFMQYLAQFNSDIYEQFQKQI